MTSLSPLEVHPAPAWIASTTSTGLSGEPYGRMTLLRALWNPATMVDMVLAEPRKLMTTIGLVGRGDAAILVVVLLVASGLTVLPYGLVLHAQRFWHMPALFLGSTLICFPSLHVFGTFVGQRTSITQTFLLAMVISAVAGVFTLGFAPILWFLRATMADDGAGVLQAVSAALLAASLGAGVVQIARCVAASRALSTTRTKPWFLALWTVLLMFICYRMGTTLGLLP